MAGVIESIKKVYSGENAKKTHLILFAICFVYMLCSSLFDIATGKPDTMKQNIFDILFSLFIAVYSIQFIHNALFNINEGELPPINGINPKSIIPLIGLNLLWGVYLFVAILIATVIYFVAKSLAAAVILGLLILAVAPFFEFIYIGFADKYETKCLLNIALIFRFLKASFVPFWITTFKTLFITLAVIVVYLAFYFAGGYFGFAEMFPLAKDYYAFDAVILPIFMYTFAVIWYFAFPYALLDLYKEKIRPILGFECEEQAIVIDGENA